jgi:hypothetical protein
VGNEKNRMKIEELRLDLEEYDKEHLMKKAMLISPIVDMEKLILDMMKFTNLLMCKN